MEVSEAERYLSLANTYWASAQRLRDEGEPATRSPFYLLAAHTIELALKAVLLGYGVPIDGLTMVGHNLDACMRHAERRGFPKLPVRGARTLARLSAAHHAQAFRYPQFTSWALPDPDETMSIATRILRVATEHVADRAA